MYEPIFTIMQRRHPLPAGQRLPTFDEIVASLWDGLRNRVSRAWNYDKGVEKPDNGYGGAEDPAKRAADTIYRLVPFKRN